MFSLHCVTVNAARAGSECALHPSCSAVSEQQGSSARNGRVRRQLKVKQQPLELPRLNCAVACNYALNLIFGHPRLLKVTAAIFAPMHS